MCVCAMYSVCVQCIVCVCWVCVHVCVTMHVTMLLEVSNAAICYLTTIVLWGAVGSNIRFLVFKTLCETADIHTIEKYQTNLSVSIVLSSKKYAKASATDKLNT